MPTLSASDYTNFVKLKAANADVILPSSYSSDAILIMRAMAEIGYKPKAVLAQAAGFQESAFMQGAAALAEGASVEAAIGMAQKAAALTATRPGAFAALPSRDEWKSIRLGA